MALFYLILMYILIVSTFEQIIYMIHCFFCFIQFASFVPIKGNTKKEDTSQITISNYYPFLNTYMF